MYLKFLEKYLTTENIERLEKIHPWIWGVIGWILIATIGFLDYITGHELGFSLFYLIPIFLVTWFTNKKLSLVSDIVSAIVWLLAEKMSGQIYSHPSIFLWNTGIRFGFFLIVTLLLDALKRSLANQQKLARIDGLTGAINARHFWTILTSEIYRCQRYNRPLTLAYIDLDNFKQVNDQLGHNFGDRLLCLIVQYMSKNLRNIDTVGRLGGDEFVVLLPETEAEQAHKVFVRLQQSLLLEMANQNLPVTFSIGVVTYLEMPADIDIVIRSADNLMYQVKHHGKNAIAYATYPESLQ